MKANTEKFDALVKLFGMDVKVVKSIKTWAFGSAILSGISTTAGYGPGVDAYFLEKAKGNKTILELEGIAYQYDLLNSFSDLDQENAFIGDLKGIDIAVTELNGMYDSYKAGDEKALIELLLRPVPNVSADYNKKLLTDRNIGMADKIDSYLKTKDTYFVIAGAAHFIGDSSVIEFLTKKGYTVERIK